MLSLLTDGHYVLFAVILGALIIALSFHEFGHAVTAKYFGDDTAEKMGRISLNPKVHMDLGGTLLLIFVGFGYAKPVPTNPNNFNSKWADLFISAAGPFMNLLLAVIAINLYILMVKWGVVGEGSNSIQYFVLYFTQINMLLMVFNLIPIGALDGHYILPYFLPRRLRRSYVHYNAKYGNHVFMILILASIAGVPVFREVLSIGQALIPWIIFV